MLILQRYVANAFLARQLQLLGGLVRRAQAEAPTATLMRISWDETSQKITLPLNELQPEQGQSAYPIMFVHLKVLVLWGSESFSYRFVFPPLLVLRGTAEAMHNAMFHHPAVQPV